LSTLQKLGINRVSFGPFIFRSCLQHFTNIAKNLRTSEDYTSLATVMPGTDVAKYLHNHREQ
ncbi:MAG TPA: hypothetical protein VHS31_08960, partial [Tepidisphaeraceae bacterium]|nr:hypothetical protein [Tepidisphaeraceae bacterium]